MDMMSPSRYPSLQLAHPDPGVLDNVTTTITRDLPDPDSSPPAKLWSAGRGRSPPPTSFPALMSDLDPELNFQPGLQELKPNSRKRQRLTEERRRARLIRTIGVCLDCRRRKAKCDLSHPGPREPNSAESSDHELDKASVEAAAGDSDEEIDQLAYTIEADDDDQIGNDFFSYEQFEEPQGSPLANHRTITPPADASPWGAGLQLRSIGAEAPAPSVKNPSYTGYIQSTLISPSWIPTSISDGQEAGRHRSSHRADSYPGIELEDLNLRLYPPRYYGVNPIADLRQETSPPMRHLNQARGHLDRLDANEHTDLDWTRRVKPKEPTLEGFKEQIRALNPHIEPFLAQRLAEGQVKRYNRLLNIHVEHEMTARSGNCLSGKFCAALGTYVKYLESGGHGIQWPRTNRPTPAYLTKFPFKGECDLCFEVKTFSKPSAWTKHSREDLQPFQCTFPECETITSNFVRKCDWVRHENERHRHLESWKCQQVDCGHMCHRKDNFLQHLIREHKLIRCDELIDAAHENTSRTPAQEPCRFCGHVSSSWSGHSRHLARHLEQIAASIPEMVAEAAWAIEHRPTQSERSYDARQGIEKIDVPFLTQSPIEKRDIRLVSPWRALSVLSESESVVTEGTKVPLPFPPPSSTEGLRDESLPDDPEPIAEMLEIEEQTLGDRRETLGLEPDEQLSHKIRNRGFAVNSYTVSSSAMSKLPTLVSGPTISSYDNDRESGDALARLPGSFNVDSGMKIMNRAIGLEGLLLDQRKTPNEAQLELNDLNPDLENVQGEEIVQGDQIAHPAETIYSMSDSTSQAPSKGMEYVTELVKELIGQIRPLDLDVNVLRHICNCLPALLKAFALKFGFRTQSPFYKDISYFVHKQRL